MTMTAPLAPGAPRAGRIFVLDPSLGRSGGHHAVVAAHYARLLAPAPRAPMFIGHRSARDVAALPAFNGLFSYQVEDAFRVTLRGAPWLAHLALATPLRALVQVYRGFRGAPTRIAPPHLPTQTPLDLGACLRLVAPLGAEAALDALRAAHAPGPADDVVVLAADPAVMAALYTQRAFWFSPEAPRLHIHFMYPEDAYLGGAAVNGFTDIYRAIAAASPPPLLWAESAPHAADLSTMLGRDVRVAVPPLRLSPLPAPPQRAFTVAVLGGARADKGFLLAPDIVARAPTLSFRIQGAHAGSGLERAAAALARAPNVTLLPASLPPEAYEQELARAHVLLLPYDARAFARRGSGVLVDALAGGRPFVCTRGSALESQGKGESGLTAEGAAEFAQALAEIAAHYPRFAAAATARAERQLREIHQSPLLSALMERNFAG